MQATLAGYAANGVMVHYLDLNLVLADVQANPGAYGITNGLVCPIFPDPTCLINSNGYLFYGDALHLTTAGFAIVGRYVAAQLTAPLTLQAPSDLALDTAHQFGRTLASRMTLAGSRSSEAAAGLRVFLVGDIFSRSVESDRHQRRLQDHRPWRHRRGRIWLRQRRRRARRQLSRPKAEFGNDAAHRRTARSRSAAMPGSISAARSPKAMPAMARTITTSLARAWSMG